MMERNKYLHINPQKCEQFLSSFGRRVLHELMRQWDKERETTNTCKKRRHHSHTKKVLNFNDDSLRASATIPCTSPPPIQTYSMERPENLNLIQDFLPEVRTSEELTIPFNTPEHNNTYEFLHPTAVSKNVMNEALNNEELDQTAFKTVKHTVENANGTDTLQVNWDNMFDSELFGDITGKVANKEVANELNVSNDIFLTDHAKTIINTDFNESSYEKGDKKRKTKTTTQPRNTKKIKQENTILIEPLEKSTNISDTIPNNFRKEKYTKTVKKWLNDVKLYNPITKEIELIDNIISDEKEYKTDTNKYESSSKTVVNNNKLKIIIDKSMKANKKVVQAQLTNKDGIMKFSKPKTDIVKSRQETCDGKEVRDKKNKGPKKFVPPIKSQIPVKDIVYEIITVDDSNINHYFNKINFMEESKLIAALVYSNGFCQLNSHFTDGTCVADSVLLATDDIFYCFKGTNQNIKAALARIFVNNRVISYDARSILIYFASHLQMDIYNIKMYDVKIGASLLDPDNPPENFSDLQKLLSFTAPYAIATECPQQKASWYTLLLRDCWVRLKEMLIDYQLWQVFEEIEVKLLPIISEMECRGVSIDLSKLKSFETILLSKMQQIEQKCYKAAGKVFQINSTVQVRAILYDELKLDSKCNVKIRETLSGGLKSTSEIMLRSLMSVHDLPKLILEYRHLHKAHATFLAGIAQHVKHNVVKPTWLQTAAATGRIASSNPNLQAIPRVPFNLVMFPDNGDTANVQLKFRSLYVSRAGHCLLAADFKHIECRVFAHLAADETLAQALAHDNDFFTVLAALWLDKPEDTVTPSERERTKRLVYASLYGAGTRKLMEILDVSYEQALQVAASFNRTFPSLKSFGRQVVSKCSQSGGRLSTLCGRVRHFTNITSGDFRLRSHAERQAVNFVVQGSAADLCKRAMILTEEQLRSSSPPVEAHLLLQIHDELVWEVKRQHLPKAASIIKQVMEGCGEQCGMSTLLPVAITVGDNWGEMEHYTLP